MIFLPIVERELRVAARKRSTIWFRVLAALISLVIGTGFVTMSLVFGASPAKFGTGLFETLTWLAMAAVLAAGLFFTADSLSEEKRQGTLGFLFLTDLRGYDVVGGKLLATSLRGSYALLALFPVLAVTLLLGGVTGLQFLKGSLALVNALFCSLTCGLLVSAVSRDSQRAMGGTFFLLLLVCAGGPVADSILAVSRGGGFKPVLSMVSPVYVFWAADAWGNTSYWLGLGLSHLFGWGCFALACILVPIGWQDKQGQAPGTGSVRSYSWKYGHGNDRESRRRKLIGTNPVLWLASREHWQSIAVWVLASLVLSTFIAVASSLPSMVLFVWGSLSWLVILLLYLWTASQASRFFVEARRSGLMELLLVSPLSSGDIVAGQWRALLRTFGLPVGLLLAVQVAGGSLSHQASMKTMGGVATAGAFNGSFSLSLFTAAVGALTTGANLLALMWVGMWMGLTSKSASIATLKTLLFVEVLPWFGISFASAALSGILMYRRIQSAGVPSNNLIFIFPLLMVGLSAALTLAKDAVLLVWARERLRSTFRTEAARSIHAPAQSRATQNAVAIPMPPIIAH
jgi:ABC-type transport system involved in multi-copper enzyme maturation permease subunit